MLTQLISSALGCAVQWMGNVWMFTNIQKREASKIKTPNHNSKEGKRNVDVFWECAPQEKSELDFILVPW